MGVSKIKCALGYSHRAECSFQHALSSLFSMIASSETQIARNIGFFDRMSQRQTKRHHRTAGSPKNSMGDVCGWGGRGQVTQRPGIRRSPRKPRDDGFRLSVRPPPLSFSNHDTFLVLVLEYCGVVRFRIPHFEFFYAKRTRFLACFFPKHQRFKCPDRDSGLSSL